MDTGTDSTIPDARMKPDIPPPKYPPLLTFTITKDDKTISVEVPKKHADEPDPYNVVTLGMLHGGKVRLK